MTDLDLRLVEAARSGTLVVFAGAGVSAGEPSSLPSWYTLNEMIAEQLLDRSEDAFEGYLRADALKPAFGSIGAAREEQRFPPEYQAQLVEEMAGSQYFDALTSLDVDTFNEAHSGIAALAAAGCLAAVVTTNFDRLIEHALDAQGVPYLAAKADASYEAAAERFESGDGPLTILKVHGCVSEPPSLVDTLKQRRLGRAASVDRCIDALAEYYFAFVGFSASDLDGDPEYLDLVPNAGQSVGATYVVWPGAVTGADPTLGSGARILMDAYGERGSIAVEEAATFLSEILLQTGHPPPTLIPTAGSQSTVDRVHSSLSSWANSLTPGAVGLCLSALLEAAGEGDTAARVLDRLIRKVLLTEAERRDPHYPLAQLHYGRLGAAWGRYVNVPDMHGTMSNASVESLQSLLRLTDTDLEAAALGWTALGWLWLGEGRNAIGTALRLSKLADDPAVPLTPEGWVDSWIAVAQVLLLDAAGPTIELIMEGTAWARTQAIEAGDVVRAARVGSLFLLAEAETTEDLPAALAELENSPHGEFAEALRVGDGFSLGLRELAIGRWLIGVGGRALIEKGEGDVAGVAAQAAEHLTKAAEWIERQVMDPWQVFIALQWARVLADLGRWDEIEGVLTRGSEGAQRFPIWASHFHETRFQLNHMLGNTETSEEELTLAVAAAEASGLANRREWLAATLAELFPETLHQ
ncbi:MAG: SIR2 family protein [Actinomycetota bacterium]|nr:SIR2 family protein [Actinomycetota bacterium]